MCYLRLKTVGVLSLTLFFSQTDVALSQQLLILHTNDLHSQLNQGDTPSRGSYPAVKAKILELKAQAQKQGIDTLVLDAGDFSEGSPYYMADEGQEVWKIIDSMGYDAVALGNHDWLVGPQQMESIVNGVKPNTPFLSANFTMSASFEGLSKYILPYTEFQKAGMKIAVLGLSTDQLFYNWCVKEGGRISQPEAVAKEIVPDLQSRNDFVFALTHLGVKGDKTLARTIAGIDLVVGGHSHTELYEAKYVRNPQNIKVPIVQAGQHGEYVGYLLVNLEKGKALQVEHYELVPVYSSGPRDPEMEGWVTHAHNRLVARYGEPWLGEVIGYSEVPMERPLDNPTDWGYVFADAIQESAQADLALDIGVFYGEDVPAGPITREKLMWFFPRTFDLTQPLGWTVWKIRAPGWLIKDASKIAAQFGKYISVSSNVTFKIEEDSKGKKKIKDFKINGEPMKDFKEYDLAVTEGLGRGGTELSILLKTLFQPKDTGVPIWTAVERRIQAVGGVIKPYIRQYRYH